MAYGDISKTDPTDDLKQYLGDMQTLTFEPGTTPPALALESLLIDAGLLGTRKERLDAVGKHFWEGTPGSVQVIKSGALGLTKWWAGLVAVAGSVGGAAAVVLGAIKNAANELGDSAPALVSAGALMIAAAFIAIAIFVGADLLARGKATAARHSGRAEVIAAYLSAVGRPRSPAPMLNEQEVLALYALFTGKLFLTMKESGVAHKVTGVRSTKSGYRWKLENGDEVGLEEVDGHVIKP